MRAVPRLRMMSDHNVRMMSAGPPETVLPEPPASFVASLGAIGSLPVAERRRALLDLVARHPALPHAWAALGAASADGAEAYMAYRVGYHRGLDLLRANGWRGSGFVRHHHASNRGFLDCLSGLARQAAIIGEEAEAVRCTQFLAQLDPAAFPIT
jgi:hypothetical protein